MVKSFINKGLSELFESGRTAKINKQFPTRLLERLDALDAASRPGDMNVPGWNFHPLSGFLPVRYSVHVNGPWCLTFEFDNTNAHRVSFEQYH